MMTIAATAGATAAVTCRSDNGERWPTTAETFHMIIVTNSQELVEPELDRFVEPLHGTVHHHELRTGAVSRAKGDAAVCLDDQRLGPR
jgi:hypothetical protein